MGTQKAIPTDPQTYAHAVEIVKSRVMRWPSAYASGQVVTLYKSLMKDKNKKAYTDAVPKKNTALTRWYKEDWIDIYTGKPCGTRASKSNHYPTCRPNKIVNASTPVTASELTASQKKHMIAQKQKAREKTVHYIETRKI